MRAWLLASFLLLVLSRVRAESPIVLAALDGKPVPLASVQRDVTLVAFWSVACVPCLEEMPLLDALAKKLAGDARVTVIGINVDGPDSVKQVRAVLAEKKIGYATLFDPDQALRKLWYDDPDSLGLPTLVAFDRKRHGGFTLGFSPGETAARFIADWLPRLDDVKAGMLKERLQKFPSAGHEKAPMTDDQLRPILRQMVKSHHPDLTPSEIDARVQGILDERRKDGSVVIH